MEFCIAGIILIIIIRYLLSNSEDLFKSFVLLCVTIEIFVELGFIFKIGSWDFSCARLIEDFLALYCFLNYHNVTDFFKNKWITLCVCYLLPIVFLVLFPTDILAATTNVTWDNILLEGESPTTPSISFSVITATLRSIMYAFTAAYIYSVYTVNDYKNMIYNLSRICTIILTIAVFEAIFKNFMFGNDIWGATIKLIFGETDSTIYEGRIRGNLYELTLFTKEASHYSYMIFITTIIKMADNILQNNRILSGSVLLCFILMIISTSFSSFVLVATILVIMLLYRWEVIKPFTKKYEIITFLLTVILSLSSVILLIVESDWFLGDRLSSFIDNFSDLFTTDWSYDVIEEDRSSYVRIISIIQTLIAFTVRPLFGFSLNSIACHGASAQLLAGIGVVGLFFWIRHYFYLFPLYSEYNVCKKGYAICIALYLFVNMFNSIGLRPFYELTPLVFAVCCSIIFSVPYTEENEYLKENE